MICATNTSNALLRKATGRNKTVVCSFSKLIEQFTIDPALMSPPRDVYIVTNDDIMTAKLKAQFEDAAANKHVNTKIIFVNKGKKAFYPDGCPGVDAVLQNAKSDDLVKAIGEILRADISENKQRELGAAPIERIHTQDTSNAYKLSRERAKKPEGRTRGGIKQVASQSVTGMPIILVEGKAMYISQATDPITQEPIEPPRYYSVASNGEFVPVYADGSPVETDEYGNILDPFICLDETGVPIFEEETNVVQIDEVAKELHEEEMKANSPTTATDIIPTNNAGIMTYDEVENKEGSVVESGVDIGKEMGIGEQNPTSYASPLTSPTSPIESNILNRAQEASKVADLTQLMHEMNASTVIKELIQTNSTYYGIEEKLKALQDAIFVIMNDRSYESMTDKFSKITAMMHDKNFCNAAGNTMIEQLTTEIVTMVIKKAQDCCDDRLTAINEAIKRSGANASDVQDQPAALAALTDERSSIIVELTNLECDLRELFLNTDGFIKSVGDEIAKRIETISGDEDFDTWVKARGAVVSDMASLTAISKLLDLSVVVPEKIEEIVLKVKASQNLLRKLLQVENEMIEAQKMLIENMRNRSVAGKVVAQTELKKSLNVFVGTNNVGKTIVPYLFAKYKSKQNCHVLLINISQNNKFNRYGIPTVDYDDFAIKPQLEDFLVVTGNIANEVAAAQQFIATLTRAVDYYKRIYVVMDDTQMNLFNTIAPDVFSVNYIVDTNPVHLESTRKFIDSINLENVAERIFINRCNINLKPILKNLGKEDSWDYQICKVDDIQEITEGSLMKFDPYGISSVTLNFEELHRHVKS